MKLALMPSAVLIASMATPALADPVSNAEPTVTLLHLSVVGTVQETPDLLVADLVGTISATDPAAAQRQLDAKMKAATGVVGGNQGGSQGVDWQVAGYSVEQSAPDQRTGRAPWTAQQTLHLTSGNADTLLGLVGKLQGMGLTVGSLQWELSPARRTAAQQRASEQALKLLRTRADAAATTLGLKVAGIRSVTLLEDVRLRPMPMMRMMAASSEAPQASRTDTDVSETADAEIALIP